MRIGVPKEVKDGEARVGLTPEGVGSLVADGHEVWVQADAGARSGFEDQAYKAAGARLVVSPEEVYACPMVVKVKELQRAELLHLHPGTLVLAYQQLSRDPVLLQGVLNAGITCMAYEGVVLPGGARPLLAPMSTLAGLLSPQIAAWALQRREGHLSGCGILLSGMADVAPANVLILGEGVAGSASAEAFLRLGCRVVLLGRDAARMAGLQQRLSGGLETVISSEEALAATLPKIDVVVGAVSIPGRLTPKLISRTMLQTMRPGTVLIDIGIDMGGIAETSQQTKLSDPLFVEAGVLHYGVPNIPALVPRTATQALCLATLPYVARIAAAGLAGAVEAMPELREGWLVDQGRVVHPGLAQDTGRPWQP